MMNFFYKDDNHKDAAILCVKIKASSKKDAINGHILKDNIVIIKISLKEKAKNFKANESLIRYLSDIFSVPKSDIFIKSGHKSNFKRIFFKNFDLDYLNFKINNYIHS